MLTLHTNRHAVHGGFTLKDDCERQVWNAGAASWTQRENHDRCSTWAINNHNLWAKYFTSLRHYIAEDLIVSCRTQWSEQLSCRWMSDGPNVPHVHERGTWQLCHVRRLAFPLNISFYLMQHSPLWRSKFRILRIKKAQTWEFRTQVQRNTGHPIWELHKDRLEENRSYYWQGLVTE